MSLVQVGFDELGGTDEFSTEELEERLAKSNMLTLDGETLAPKGKPKKNSVRQSAATGDSDSD